PHRVHATQPSSHHERRNRRLHRTAENCRQCRTNDRNREIKANNRHGYTALPFCHKNIFASFSLPWRNQNAQTMNKGLLTALIIGGLLVILIFWAFGSYNGLVSKEEAVSNAWSNVESQYQRRAD